MPLLWMMFIIIHIGWTKANNHNDERFLFEELIQRIQQLRFPHQRNCDILDLSGTSPFLQPGNQPWASINLGSDFNVEFLQLKLSEKIGCLILIAETTSNTSMAIYLDLINLTGDSVLIFYGEKIDNSKLRFTEKNIIHVQLAENQEGHPVLPQSAEVSVVCRPINLDNPQEKEKLGQEKSIIYTPVDFWTKEKGFKYPNRQIFQFCEHALSRRTLNISYNGILPYIFGPIKPGADPRGLEVEVLRILAEKFNFLPVFQFKPWVAIDFKIHRVLPGGVVNDVKIGNSKIGIGFRLITEEQFYDVDYSGFLYFLNVVWATRNPQRLPSFTNLIVVFSPLVWSAVYVSMVLLSICFAASFFIYIRISGGLLKKKIIPWIDLILFPLARFVVPEPLPWFPKWSTGKFLLFLWTASMVFLVFFYTCNLRAYLIAKKYEKPIWTIQDVADKKKHVYASQNAYQVDDLRVANLQPAGKAVSVLLHKTPGGIYDLTKYNQKLPDYIRNDIMENGAVYLQEENAILFEYIVNKSHGFPNIQYTRESAFTSYCGFMYQKNIPWKRDVDRAMRWLRDMGFVKKILQDGFTIAATIKWNPQDNQDDLEPITLEHLLMALWLISFGLFVGIMVFVVEMTMKYASYGKTGVLARKP